LQDEQDLGDIYANWIALVETRQRAALHSMIESGLWILLALIAVYVANRIIERLFTGMIAENKRVDTLRSVVKFGAQAVGALVILFVIFGMPTQTTTVLGLAGAGLTVAMKDFIVAFFGWFILMGRNGIRVGDWVEINGVGGEVVEIGLFRTALLETGNWTDKGHPTGRRVTFINNFAITGQYFNFSTTGQWMWDEITVNIPPGADTYKTIDAIHDAVIKETQNDASLAEREWQSLTRQNGLSQFKAAPSVDMRPASSGVDIVVRYVTRAGDRFDMRNRLYQSVIDLLHKQNGLSPEQPTDAERELIRR
jgi:small-conductance mechanosensitive channel